MSYSTDELLSEISDYWNKDKNSNIYKLFDIIVNDINQIENDADKVSASRAIANATSGTLDLHGADRRVSRPTNDDDFYRFIISIRAKIANATGTFNNIKDITSSALQTNEVIKVWQTEPHHLKIALPALGKDSIEKEHILADSLQQLLDMGNWLDGIQWEVAGKSNTYYAIKGFCSETCSGTLKKL